jgi:Rne/Rng family ribonuclease
LGASASTRRWKALARRVDPVGGHIVIDHTEAMIITDAEHRPLCRRPPAGTTFRTNLKPAAHRKLRLRDIGGIIVIDFIDMSSKTNRGGVAPSADSPSTAPRPMW